MPKVEIAKVLKAIHRLEDYGEKLPRQFARHVRGKIWELKEDKYRILYFTFVRGKFVILKVFMKKTAKTPERELRTAENRMGNYLTRHGDELL